MQTNSIYNKIRYNSKWKVLSLFPQYTDKVKLGKYRYYFPFLPFSEVFRSAWLKISNMGVIELLQSNVKGNIKDDKNKHETNMEILS